MPVKPAHIVIIGGGFGGLYAAQNLKQAPARMTLIDRRNFHLFQPLLYQVATGGLSPANISAPLRAILKKQKNTAVLLAEVQAIDPANRQVHFSDGESLSYDYLVVATGASHNYFGNAHWEPHAPGLKTIEDATEIRRRVLLAFESAERETDPERRKAWLRFVVVGGGPTGVELAGALGEIAHETLRDNFRQIDPAQAEILLVEAGERILAPYAPELSEKARQSLEKLGVQVLLKTAVTEIQAGQITLKQASETQLATHTVLWGAGVQASPLGQVLAQATGVELDRAGRVKVAPDLSVPGYPEIFVIGDLACVMQAGKQVPGVAPAAMQEGKYVARLLRQKLADPQAQTTPFHYLDKGSMATIGRSLAVVQVGNLKFSGFVAWGMWLFIHILYLVEFTNRLLVLLQWGWNYLSRNRSARLITGEQTLPFQTPIVSSEAKELSPRV
ncbi:FAD-dependent oxidoreductase [bacterium (Candidatus Blackallbacteria) CG17_big_fil_post_rev_8_21_14_2_50_48_46]|uniref:NADH:ubiquinone reductase (non-electrogenic) n=1 Tax=bacterium (Candidatus Blackallbacteria) CG17_big_fil_post_rev_8_21_14_2_50_48_46 TaxID=2014261 RepID=A0A2M7G237_9BACT|nr:MAG: FAD-dependent oxidoreductase [bacterium (Candidatus Blackallbacteria) CG18_big_fil_WC_8_21_14_2_50_49_26]PIW15854.1 MAG: FAD-dependent oxidoreductase [bacterium (Candidatus Blackallbacteria) CG17_big_fil_post_rev_8_21_14_2_50_48_46]PIW49423.1 MAG: FAD-dependent oxidoreductase [bacterium (Candidatus Blackallbacteria) CG13_big_fil_rev_8_21_14_2_50_49_14]